MWWNLSVSDMVTFKLVSCSSPRNLVLPVKKHQTWRLLLWKGWLWKLQGTLPSWAQRMGGAAAAAWPGLHFLSIDTAGALPLLPGSCWLPETCQEASFVSSSIVSSPGLGLLPFSHLPGCTQLWGCWAFPLQCLKIHAESCPSLFPHASQSCLGLYEQLKPAVLPQHHIN